MSEQEWDGRRRNDNDGEGQVVGGRPLSVKWMKRGKTKRQTAKKTEFAVIRGSLDIYIYTYTHTLLFPPTNPLGFFSSISSPAILSLSLLLIPGSPSPSVSFTFCLAPTQCPRGFSSGEEFIKRRPRIRRRIPKFGQFRGGERIIISRPRKTEAVLQSVAPAKFSWAGPVQARLEGEEEGGL